MSAMTDVSVIALTRTGLRLRRLTRRDLPKVLLFAHRGDPLPWTDEDLPEVLDSPDTLGCLAEVPGVVAGFVLGTAERPGDSAAPTTSGQLARFFRRLVGRDVTPPHIDRLAVVVAPDCPRDEVERILLGQFGQEFCRSAGRAEVAVPETSLVAQLILREAGFKATRVLRGHYGSEDGYVMVRRPG